ncbi:MAG: hypothetical protein HZB53_20605, partial [Chloroflexi bacterium]|nr:hypothetical protein [Chloroflexota bacterium]
MVTITADGFNPGVLTVSTGSTVTWHNATALTQTVRSGVPYHLYLPAIMRGSSGGTSSPVDRSPASNGPGSTANYVVVVPPGGDSQYAFSLAGDYPHYLAGTPNQTGHIVVVDVPDFVLVTSPISQTVVQGQAVTYTVALTAAYAFSAPVGLSVTGLPSGASAAFATNPLTPTAGTGLVVTALPTATVGVYPLIVTADGGTITHTTAITVAIDAYQVNVCGSIADDTIWDGKHLYVVTCVVNVSSGAALTVEHGAIVKFGSSSPQLQVDGRLLVVGTSARPVYFTALTDDTIGGDTNNDGAATSPTPGYWQSIMVRSGGRAEIDHAVVRYGGYCNGCTGGGIVYDGTALNLSNSIIAYNGSNGLLATGAGLTVSATQFLTNTAYGLYAYGNGQTISPLIRNNTFTGNATWAAYLSFAAANEYLSGDARMSGNNGSNNAFNGIGLYGTITATTVLTANAGFPYLVTNFLNVLVSQTLSILPDVVFKFSNSSPQLQVDGLLQVMGTGARPVYFTALTDDAVGGDTNNDGAATSPSPGYWQSIMVRSGGSASLDYAIVRYGGYCYGCAGGGIVYSGAALSLTNSVVAYNVNSG